MGKAALATRFEKIESYMSWLFRLARRRFHRQLFNGETVQGMDPDFLEDSDNDEMKDKESRFRDPFEDDDYMW